MPYRRLPNTDKARIRAIECAIEKERVYVMPDLAISYKVINDARAFLIPFKKVHSLYQQCFNAQVKANVRYQDQIKTARLYISHFIQVLNLCIIRQEIRASQKEYYGLDSDNNAVPDLTSETSLLEWGEKIINGEKLRVENGGTPIYNPTIAKVKVHYDIFKESYFLQKNFQASTTRNLEQLANMRDRADGLILDIWNQVEEKFQDLPMQQKMKRCQEYGVVYYYRKKEMQEIKAARMQQKISFND